MSNLLFKYCSNTNNHGTIISAPSWIVLRKAESKAIVALKEKGFGMISEIDMRQNMNEKLGGEIQKYKILGMCNPGFAYKRFRRRKRSGPCCPAMSW